MDEDEDAFREKEATGRQQRRMKEMKEDPEKYRLKEKKRKQDYRLSKKDTVFKRRKAFLAAIRNGRIYFCICCHRKLHENQVIELDDDWQESMEEQYPGSVSRFIGPIPLREVYIPSPHHKPSQLLTGDFVCPTCKRYMEKNNMPPMCNKNNLQLVDIKNHPELKLSELEQQLVALNILFQKIVLLPKSRMNAMKDKTVSVPIAPSDVVETLTKLPRTPTDARLAVVQLKRRLNYPGVHNQQLISMRNVFQALRTFISMKNPHYENILEDVAFKQRCFETDPEGYKILFPEEEIDLSDLQINSQNIDGINLADLEIDSQNYKNEQDEDKEESETKIK